MTSMRTLNSLDIWVLGLAKDITQAITFSCFHGNDDHDDIDDFKREFDASPAQSNITTDLYRTINVHCTMKVISSPTIIQRDKCC